MHPINPKGVLVCERDLRQQRSVVGKEPTVLGFVSCPCTLATYLVDVSVSIYCWSMKAGAHGAPVDSYGRAHASLSQLLIHPATLVTADAAVGAQ